MKSNFAQRRKDAKKSQSFYIKSLFRVFASLREMFLIQELEP